MEPGSEPCVLASYPGGSQWPAAANYIDSLAAVVACGGVDVADASRCWAFDGSSWTPLPRSNQPHCYFNSPNLQVDQGWWVAGTLQTGSGGFGGCSFEWTSEVFTGEDWIQGPQHPTGVSIYSCLVNVNATHTLMTGGQPIITDSWLYDWTAGVWTQTGSMNEGRFGHGCVVLDGQGVLVVGGSDGGNVYSVELYDPETGTWTLQPSLPEDIWYPFGPALLALDHGTAIALFDREDRVFQRTEDGTWSALSGVVLPSTFGGYPSDKVTMVPEEFATGCM